MLMFTLSYLDRGNIGNANVAGMSKDLNLSASQYQWLLTIFYISYALFDFLNVAWKIFPPRYWAAFITLAWGTIAMCQGAAQNWSAMMALRFLLGIAEAAFGSGVPMYLSFFYFRHELGIRMGFLLGAAPLASAWAGALAYGITQIQSSIASWRLLFIIEGAPTIIAAPIIFFFLADRPNTARFLTSRQKEVAVARLAQIPYDVAHETSINKRLYFLAIRDWRPYCNALIHFASNVSFGSLSIFLPTIIKEMGYTSIQAQGRSSPVFLFAFFMVLVGTYVSDRFKQRGIFVASWALIGAIGYLVQATVATPGVRYFATYLSAAGVYTAISCNVTWLINNSGGDSQKSANLFILQIIGQSGNFLGTALFPATDGPRYIKGTAVCGAFMFFVTCASLLLSLYYRWENKRRDQRFGEVTGTESPIDISHLGDKHPGFRYIV